MTAAPGQVIPIVGVPNLRDLGGWETPDGRVRPGQVYRSAEFSGLTGDAATGFGDLGVRTVYDFRTTAERAAQPNAVPPGTEYVVLDVLADRAEAGPAQMLEVLTDPRAAEDLLGGGKAVAMFEQSYREFIDLPSARTAYHQFFSALATKEHRPALFHCTTGKDRTGWGAASLLMLLGVDDDDVLRDYMLTNDALLPALRPMVDQFASVGGDPGLLQPVIGVRPEYLDAARDEMERTYSSIERYFTEGLGLSTETIDTLRADLVTDR
jgi:protein-tyrosine phosphatase